MRQLPTGTITMLFTDIEGSTRLLQRLGEQYASLLKECRRLLRQAFQAGNGFEVDTQGDAFFVVFERAIDAVLAAVNAQRALYNAAWPGVEVVRVRMGIHTGEPLHAEEGYVGLDVHCAARIMNSAHGGQVLLSRKARDVVVHDLPEDVSLRDLGEYRLKDISELNHLFQLVVSDLPADFPPPSTLDLQDRFQNLPAPATSFVGREQEVAIASERLRQRDVRLLTLIGTAGVGKTRLALQVASELRASFKDGVCFVPLEQVSDVEGVIPAIAQALRIQAEKDQPLLEKVVETLCERSLLLILDNFEHVLQARTVVANLLAACPKLKILVTSRVMLHMRAEHLQEVPPLALPEHGHLDDLANVGQTPSIVLFVQRVQAIQPYFELTRANVTEVAEICTYLDGIPLAIELAAARLRHFSPQLLLANLRKGPAFLQGSGYDVPARQQTLQAAIAWSYDLLGTEEQMVFRRLAVTVQGITPAAAEEICGAAGGLKGSVLDALNGLVDQSMLQRQERERGEMCFWLLQTLREYGLERLAQAGELEATQTAHATYFLSWSEQVAPLLLGAEQADWLDRMDREYENVRVALEWLLERGLTETEQAEHALRLCTALMGFWETRGYISDGLAFVERALSESMDVAPAIRAQALHGAGFLALMQEDNTRAESFLHESQQLFRESGDKAGMANILRLQGSLALSRSTYKLARRLLEEALLIYRELGDTWRLASTRKALAQVAITQCDFRRARFLLEEDLATYRAAGEKYSTAYPLYLLARAVFLARDEFGRAQTLVEESLDLFREVNNRRFVAYTRTLLGQILLARGEDLRARSMLEAGIASFRVLKERSGLAEALIALGRLAIAQNDYEAARASYLESWDLLRAISARELSASCLEGFGEALVRQREMSKAVQLWAAAATVRATIMAPMPPVYRGSYLHAVSSARKKLGEEAFQQAWAQGHEMPLEQVLLAEYSAASARARK